MNSKGFTLVELLLTIAVLGLIVGIAVPGYFGVSNAIRKNQRENLIDKIEIAASKYAFDSGKVKIFVDELITEGYIDSDDDNGNIIDPLNRERMNCYIVEMEKSNDYYNAKFIDNENYDNNGVCDINKLKEHSESVSILVDGKTNEFDGKWTKDNEIILTAHGNNVLEIDCIENRCAWTSTSGASKIGSTNITIKNIEGLLDTKYIFQYTVYDGSSSELKRYKTSVDLKIDNESPVIYDEEITISDQFINTDTKSIKVVASDGKGSGIAGYYMSNSISNCNLTSIANSFQTSENFTITENGEYLICVKDNVGNISTSSLTINTVNEG